MAMSSQCARMAAFFLGATQRTKASSTAKIPQMIQFAVCANGLPPF